MKRTPNRRQRLLWWAGYSARTIVGGLFLLAGLSKVIDPSRFVGTVDWVVGSGIIAGNHVGWVKLAVPRAEIVLGICLVLGLYTRVASVVASMLLVGFTGALVLAIGSDAPPGACGCFGIGLLDTGGPWTWLARNMGLLALCSVALLWGQHVIAADAHLGRRRTKP